MSPVVSGTNGDELLSFARGLAQGAHHRDEQTQEAREILDQMTPDEQIDFLVQAIRLMADDLLHQWIRGIVGLAPGA